MSGLRLELVLKKLCDNAFTIYLFKCVQLCVGASSMKMKNTHWVRLWESGYRLSSLLKNKLQKLKWQLNFQSCNTVTCVAWEIVTCSDVCYYCGVLDCETLIFSWVNLILIFACEKNEIWTLTSLGCGREKCSLRWGIQNSTFPRGSRNEIGYCMKILKGLRKY